MASKKALHKVHFDFKAEGSKAEFKVVKFQGRDSMSDLFYFEIDLASTDKSVDLDAILKDKVSLTMTRGDEKTIYEGALASFEQLQLEDKYVMYRAILVPNLWFLTLNHQSRVFLDKTTPEIIEEVLKGANLSAEDYEIKVNQASYPKREFVVQHKETDWAFISRLMEHVGIFYFYSEGKVIFSDHSSIHQSFREKEEILYRQPKGMHTVGEEAVHSLTCRQQTVPHKVQLQEYNYRKPKLDLKADEAVLDQGMGMFMDYGDHYKDTKEGSILARIRGEEIKCRQKLFMGEGDCRAFRSGFKFSLADHYRPDFDKEYLLIEVQHSGSQTGDFMKSQAKKKQEEQSDYRNEFVCIPANVDFRPERTTSKPRIYGSLSAKVDAAGSGEYAEVDDQGRYKVILPFDLSGRKDGKASRWIRMAQPYAGMDYGLHFPLHKGTEVLLTFIDGDPDRPIIQAAVPNPETKSPVTSENQTKSIIRDNYGNEIVLDSTPGDEHIRIHSPHHNSGIEIGKSVKSYSESDQVNVGRSNSFEAILGTKTELLAGSKLEAKLGFFGDLTMGFGFGMFLGGQHSFSAGYSWEKTYGPSISESSGDSLASSKKDYIVAAGDQFCIVGNAKQSPPYTNSFPVIYGGEDLLKLSMGKVLKGEQKLDYFEDQKMHIKQVALIALLSAATTGSLIMATHLRAAGKTEGEYFDYGSGALAALTVLVGGMLAFSEMKDDQIEPVEHDKPDAEIGLKNDGTIQIKSSPVKNGKLGLFVKSKNGKIELAVGEDKNAFSIIIDKKIRLANLEQKSDMIIDEEGNIKTKSKGMTELKSDENMMISSSKGEIVLQAPKSVHVKSLLKHKNLMVQE